MPSLREALPEPSPFSLSLPCRSPVVSLESPRWGAGASTPEYGNQPEFAPTIFAAARRRVYRHVLPLWLFVLFYLQEGQRFTGSQTGGSGGSSFSYPSRSLYRAAQSPRRQWPSGLAGRWAGSNPFPVGLHRSEEGELKRPGFLGQAGSAGALVVGGVPRAGSADIENSVDPPTGWGYRSRKMMSRKRLGAGAPCAPHRSVALRVISRPRGRSSSASQSRAIVSLCFEQTSDIVGRRRWRATHACPFQRADPELPDSLGATAVAFSGFRKISSAWPRTAGSARCPYPVGTHQQRQAIRMGVPECVDHDESVTRLRHVQVGQQDVEAAEAIQVQRLRHSRRDRHD